MFAYKKSISSHTSFIRQYTLQFQWPGVFSMTHPSKIAKLFSSFDEGLHLCKKSWQSIKILYKIFKILQINWPVFGQNKLSYSSSLVCTPSLLGGGGEGVQPVFKFSKSRDLTGCQFLEEGCWERGVGLQFLHRK